TWPAVTTAGTEPVPPTETQPATSPSETVTSADRELEIALDAPEKDDAREKTKAETEERREARSQERPLATRPASAPAAADEGMASADSGSGIVGEPDENGRRGGQPLSAVADSGVGSAAGGDFV